MDIRSQFTPGLGQTYPADVLVSVWERGRPPAMDVTVTTGAAAAATDQQSWAEKLDCVFICILKPLAIWAEKLLVCFVWPLDLQSVLLC